MISSPGIPPSANDRIAISRKSSASAAPSPIPACTHSANFSSRQLGDRFRRTAAAKRNHHARRGGLVEHVAQMMRSAAALSPVYAELNRDLLLAGVLFHDCGKLWENTYPEHGFAQILSIHGEMMGHIPLGIELVNKLWRDLMDSPEAAAWADLKPTTEETRLHLLHLIGSHHGEYEFGSPVLPALPRPSPCITSTISTPNSK